MRNASGPIAKLRSNPPVNPSPDQSIYQNNMAVLVAYWPALSQENKDLWDAFAVAHDHTTPWGETKTLSGYQWFLCLNLSRIRYYTPPLSSPPNWATYNPPPETTLVATATYLRVEWAAPYTFSLHLAFYLSLPLRQSSVKLRRSLFYVKLLYNQSELSNYDLTSLFESLSNVTWATFWASANCSIICRLKYGSFLSGIFSAFTSAIVKIG